MSDDGTTLNIPIMARVEGRGALEISLRANRIDGVRLRIFEPPRMFEKILEGREYGEVPDIVARICGICPAAYQITGARAVENAFGMEESPTVRRFRRILACGEWISSHSLHIHLLSGPDYLGYSDVMDWARHDPGAVRRGFQLHAIGNALMILLGGRAVHPVGVSVGGFSRLPSKEDCRAVADRIRAALPEATGLVRWASGIDYPQIGRSFLSVALRDRDSYPMNDGRIVSSSGLDLSFRQFEERISEFQVPHSTAFHSLLDGRPYLVGPLARLNLNVDRMPPDLLEEIRPSGIRFPSDNMYHSLLARALEIRYALGEALSLLEEESVDDRPEGPVGVRAGTGVWATEAPRGILWHRYKIAVDGKISEARIIPPTSQNQAMMEADLRETLERQGLERPESVLREEAERIVRNYDPCISCATHFLDLSVRRIAP